MTGYEIVVTIMQFFALIGLIFSLYLTRREFVVRTRPYVGISDIVKKDSEKTNELEFDVLVNNVGTLPAKNAKLHGNFTLDDEATTFECETKGAVFPSSKELATWIIGIRDIDRNEILKGNKKLKINMTLDYQGVSKDYYQTRTNRTYDAQKDKWINEEGDWS